MAQAGRLLKESMVRELTEALGLRPSFVVTSIGPLQAVEADALRKQLSMVKARMWMIKRTLGAKALSGLQGNGHASDRGGHPAVEAGSPMGVPSAQREAELLAGLLAGSVVLVLTEEDAGPAANILAQFAKSKEGKLAVRGGWVEGRLLNAAGMDELASLPPKLQLLAHLIGTLESPITELIFTVEGVCSDVVWVLEEASKKTGSTGTTGSTAQEGS